MRKLVCGGINKQVKILVTRVLKCDTRFLSAGSSGIINSGLPDIDIPKIPINEFIFENMGMWENHIAMVRNNIHLPLK